MTNHEFILHIENTYQEAMGILKKKNADYATAENPFKNFDSAIVAGISPERAILIRVLDKFSRISNCLDKETEVRDESVADTILDSINYLAILRAKIYDTHNKTKTRM